MGKTNFLEEFPEISTQAWKQKIQYDLKGADYNETLVWDSPEGIKVKPFYNLDDVQTKTALRPAIQGNWQVGEVIYAGAAAKANKNGQSLLKKGVDCLIFHIPSEKIAIPELLSGIDLNATSLHFHLDFLSPAYIKSLVDFIPMSDAPKFLNVDILGHLAATGNWYHSQEQDHKILEDLMVYCAPKAAISPMGVDLSLYQNSGANMVQQLAYSLSHANEYLSRYELHSASAICFKVAIGSNYFFEIAKLRALRLLWNTLATEYGISGNCTILASPSKRNKTVYDYNSNMLRTSTECMAAIIGGANTICNLPYDALYHKNNEFGDRIARNQLLILKEESYFNKVSNPADGAYYIAYLTNQMAQKALDLFKQIEAGGGFLKQLKSQAVQKKIKESAAREQSRFNDGHKILVGSNKYQHYDDKMKGQLELFPFVKTSPRKTVIEPIIARRLAEELEQKRLKDE